MKFKYVVLTNDGSERSRELLCQIQSANHSEKTKIISIPFNVDQLDLACRGIIELFPSHLISDKLYSFSSKSYKAGTLGCMLNHHLSQLELLRDDCDYYVVLEDNAVLQEGFHGRICELIALMRGQGFGIIHLFSSLAHSREPFIPGVLVGSNEWGTAKAHIISRPYASSMAGRIPFHEVADGVSMIPSLTWMGSSLDSFVADPYIAWKSEAYQSSRVKSDSDFSNTGADLFNYDATQDPRLFSINNKYPFREVHLLGAPPPFRMYLSREMYLLEGDIKSEPNVRPVPSKLAQALIGEYSIKPPTHLELITPAPSSRIEIVISEGEMLAFDAHFCSRIPMEGHDVTVAWAPKDIRLPYPAYPSHFKSIPWITRKLRYAV